MKYTRSDYLAGMEMPVGIILRKDYLKSNFDDYVIRKIIEDKLSDIFIVKIPFYHINLVGTKYNFYVGRWSFGFVEKVILRKKQSFRICYVDFETIIDDPEVGEEVKEKLLFHLDFLFMK